MKTLVKGNLFPASPEGLRGLCTACGREVELEADDKPARFRLLFPEGEQGAYVLDCETEECGGKLFVKALQSKPNTHAAREYGRRALEVWNLGRRWPEPYTSAPAAAPAPESAPAAEAEPAAHS